MKRLSFLISTSGPMQGQNRIAGHLRYSGYQVDAHLPKLVTVLATVKPNETWSPPLTPVRTTR